MQLHRSENMFPSDVAKKIKIRNKFIAFSCSWRLVKHDNLSINLQTNMALTKRKCHTINIYCAECDLLIRFISVIYIFVK